MMQRRKRTLLVPTLAVALCGLLGACDDEKSDGDEAAASEPAGPAAKPGKVTVERLDQLDHDKVNSNAANFPACVREAEAQLGKASKVDGNEYWWAATAGDDCHMFQLVGNDSGMMARSKGPYKVASDELEQCRKLAG